MVSHPGLGLDPSIRSDRDRGVTASVTFILLCWFFSVKKKGEKKRRKKRRKKRKKRMKKKEKKKKKKKRKELYSFNIHFIGIWD